MPDTGAPWNIPYVAGTDLVADWPTDSETLANAIADGLDDAGKIVQIVSTVKTDTFSTTSSSFVDVTGLSVTLTPASASNKVLLIAQVTWGFSGTTNSGFYLKFDGGNTSSYVGDTAGSRIRAVYGGITVPGAGELNGVARAYSMVYLDSPATAASVIYKVQAGASTAYPVYINRSYADVDSANVTRGASSITAVEVKG